MLEKFDAGSAMPAFFSLNTGDCGCEKFVSEPPAQPTGLWMEYLPETKRRLFSVFVNNLVGIA